MVTTRDPPRTGPGLWVSAVLKPREGLSGHLSWVTGRYFLLHHSFKCGNAAALGPPGGTEHFGGARGQTAQDSDSKRAPSSLPLGVLPLPLGSPLNQHADPAPDSHANFSSLFGLGRFLLLLLPKSLQPPRPAWDPETQTEKGCHRMRQGSFHRITIYNSQETGTT